MEQGGDTIAEGRLPKGCRDWKLVTVAREEGDIDDIRAILGNDVALDAFKAGAKQYPDGSIISRVACALVASEENNKAFGQQQSFVTGPPKNGVQLLVKDSQKYAATGGWGFFQFDDGRLPTATKISKCHICHTAVQDRDHVFSSYARRMSPCRC